MDFKAKNQITIVLILSTSETRRQKDGLGKIDTVKCRIALVQEVRLVRTTGLMDYSAVIEFDTFWTITVRRLVDRTIGRSLRGVASIIQQLLAQPATVPR